MADKINWDEIGNGVTTGRYRYRMETEGNASGYFSVVDTENNDRRYGGMGAYLGSRDAISVARQLNYAIWEKAQRLAAIERHFLSGE